jgi:hypothetical protein
MKKEILWALWFAGCLCLFAVGIPQPAPAKADETSPTLRPIQKPETVSALRKVQEDVETLRGLRMGRPIPSYYFDAETLKRFVIKSLEQELPEAKRRPFIAFLESLHAVPERFDLPQMYQGLLGEQVAGFYDEDTKRLFVREDFDVANSVLARMILAHEICHALQDNAFGLKRLVSVPDNDDRANAGLSVAEGDATLLMTEYVTHYCPEGALKEFPKYMFMDQSAMDSAPHFFRQMLVFPYLQGQVFVEETLSHGNDGRDRVLREPPTTTEQVMHPEKFFDELDVPSSLTLLAPPGARWNLPPSPALPASPQGFRPATINRMGELGLRTLLEERLGMGTAADAAEGWDGDAYVVYSGAEGKWWFCWESAWDSDADALEFAGAWVTFWRSITGNADLGSLKDKDQTFRAGPQTILLRRDANRVVTAWGN